MPKKIFLISPVRKVSQEEKVRLLEYVSKLELDGHQVYLPSRDTNQDDAIGLNICQANRKAIEEADEIHIYYSKNSEGIPFDFGMTFMARKPLFIVNREDVPKTSYKSFTNVLLALDEKYRKENNI